MQIQETSKTMIPLSFKITASIVLAVLVWIDSIPNRPTGRGE